MEANNNSCNAPLISVHSKVMRDLSWSWPLPTHLVWHPRDKDVEGILMREVTVRVNLRPRKIVNIVKESIRTVICVPEIAETPENKSCREGII